MAPVRVYSHRGYGIGPLENTLHAIRKALRLGVDGIEFDVHASRDGEIVVIHDFTIDDRTHGTRYIAELTLAELKKFKIGESEQIPTLDEVLGILSEDQDVLIIIEIKPSDIESKIVKIIQEYEIVDRVLVSSFIYSVLRGLKKLNPDIPTALIYDHPLKNPVQIAVDLKCSALHPQVSYVSEDLVKKCRQSDLRLNPWAVNEEEDMHRLMEFGVDGIITDFPERLKQVLHR